MADIVSPEVRSKMMSGIRGKNTRPEMKVRCGLHAAGYRYRLHQKTLPGKPDIVLPRYKAVIFVHGCFWHGHLCHLFKWPSSQNEFWKQKIEGNIKKDMENNATLSKAGWRIMVIWECAIKGRDRWPFEALIAETSRWLESDSMTGEIAGQGV